MTDVAVRNPAQELVARVRTDVFRDQVKLALPEGVSADRFTRVAVTALQQNPEIAKCSVDSIFTSLLRAAADGLLPDGREAALVDFGGKAAYMPMINGLRKIAAEHGWVLRTDAVYANDSFDYELGEKPRLEHRPARLDQERGDVIGAYAVATHSDGRRLIEVMSKADIDKVRNVSRAKARGPWVDWYDRMAEKTAGRRLFAKLPLGDRELVARVIEASELEPGDAASMLYGPNAEHSFRARELEAGTPQEATPAPGIEDSGAEAAQPAAQADEDQPEIPPAAPETSSGAAEPGGLPADGAGAATADEAAAAPDTLLEAAAGRPPSGPTGAAAAEPKRAASETDDDEPPLDDGLGDLTVPRGTRQGMTLRAIEMGRKPEDWANWALDRAADYWPAEFKPLVEQWVQSRYPAVWEKHVAKAAA